MMGPKFSPKDVSQREMSTIYCLNAQLTMINNRNGNATPGWHLHMYYQQEERFYVKDGHYRDRVHRNIGKEYIKL